MRFGKPEGFTERVLALIGQDTLKLKDKLGVLGFTYSTLQKFWFKKEFEPHTVDVVKTLDEVDISNAVLEEYSKCMGPFPERVYPSTFKTEMLLDYQTEALEFCKKARSGLVALAIGCGKTPTAIGYAEFLGLKNMVIVPSSLKYQWTGELLKFADIPDNQKIVIDGKSRSKRDKQWNQSLDRKYTICSYDLLKQPEDLCQAIESLDNGFLIFDEIMRIKTPTSKRTKCAKELRKSAKYCIGLTGTPLENSITEFWNVLNVVNPSFLPNYDKFAEAFLITEIKYKEYFDKKTMKMKQKPYILVRGEKNVQTFRQLIQPLVFRKEKRECLNLPPSNTIVRWVESSKKQKEIEKKLFELAKEDPENILRYFTYAREAVISPDLIPPLEDRGFKDIWAKFLGEEIGDGIQTGVPARVDQLISGELKPKDIILTPRLQEVIEIVDDSAGEKLIIFSTYVRALELIRRCILKEPSAMIVGGCDIQKESEKFRGDTRILLMSEAGAEGLNLQHCHLLLTVNKAYNPAKHQQLLGRIERSGQKSSMQFYEIRDKSSVIEKRVENILSKKTKLSEFVLAKEAML